MTRLKDINVYRTSPYTVARNDRLYGDESTRDTIFANSSGANPILDVQSNFNPAANLEQTAVIENMVIDGKNNPVAGIRLRDVYNCWVRNVTIKDCDVGIIIDSTAGHSSNQNRFEHIRMMNVRQGFQFTGADNGTTHAYTTIDDVGISLKDEATAVVLSTFFCIALGMLGILRKGTLKGNLGSFRGFNFICLTASETLGYLKTKNMALTNYYLTTKLFFGDKHR